MVGEIVGNYRILSELGSGGTGVVYLAEHKMIGKKCAIKILRPELSRNNDVVERFFNEAKATSLLRHQGLVAALDFGYLPSGSAFLIMEYLEGESLATRLKREGRLPPHLILDVSEQVAHALGAAHAHGITHRDLKPDNIYLVPVGGDGPGQTLRVKVLDFGIAKLHGTQISSSIKTKTGQLMGTPAYMSPEQCRGLGKVDHRSDIYSLGCLMYQLATGQTVFTGEGPGDVIAQHLNVPAPSLRAINPGLRVAFEKIVTRMLEKKVDDRYQTMDDVAADVAAVAAGREPSGVVIAPAVIQPVPHNPAAAAVGPDEPTPPRRAAGPEALTLRPPADPPVAPPPQPVAPSSTGRLLTILATAILLAGGVLVYFLLNR